MASVYLKPTGTVSSSGIGSSGCSGVFHNCVNNGIRDGGTPDDDSWVSGNAGEWVRFSFDTPDLEGQTSHTIVVRVRADSNGGAPISTSQLQTILYTDGSSSDGGRTALFAYLDGFREFEFNEYSIAKTAAQLANMEFRVLLTDDLLNAVFCSEIEIEIRYDAVTTSSTTSSTSTSTSSTSTTSSSTVSTVSTGTSTTTTAPPSGEPTSILGHEVPCTLCNRLREITGPNADDTYTVELCVCGGGFVFYLIDPELATAKPPWDKIVGGIY